MRGDVGHAVREFVAVIQLCLTTAGRHRQYYKKRFSTISHMEIGMRMRLVQISEVAVVFALVAVVGCTAVEHPAPPPLERIPVSDFTSVAGDWEGLMVQTPPTRYDNWVHLKIQPDGAFHFEAYRTIGVFSGTGVFTLEDGTLLADSAKGKITAQLYRHAGKNDRIVKAQGTSGDGITYHAELTPSRRR